MDERIQLRAARAQDRDALIRLLHRSWRHAFAPHLPESSSQRYFAAAIAENYVAEAWPQLVVAARDGDVVGLAHADDDLIASLHVEPDAWGRGIGRQLLREAERQIAARGRRVARLQVEAFNQRAIDLYRRAGYFEIARRPDDELGSGGKSILFGKPLSAAPGRTRAYTADDRAACLALFDSNVPKSFAPEERADFIELLDDLGGPYLLIEDADGALLACGGFERDRKDASVAALCWGMVRQDRHGQRLGERLLRERLDLIATDPAFRTVAIETTPMSRGFFERFGFVATKVVPDGFVAGYDLVEMKLRLERETG